jgi:hypothetical protein
VLRPLVNRPYRRGDCAVVQHLGFQLVGCAQLKQRDAQGLREHHSREAFKHDRSSCPQGAHRDRDEIDCCPEPLQRPLAVARNEDDAWQGGEQGMLPASLKREGTAEELGDPADAGRRTPTCLTTRCAFTTNASVDGRITDAR